MKTLPLLKLLKENKGRGVFRSEMSEDEATVYLYDVIVSDDYWGGVSAQSFVKELISIDTEIIHLRINSPGGDVFAAVAMSQAIKEHKAKVIAHVDGYAASAATQLLMAADESVIAEGGMVMIHKAWSIALGNSDDMLAMADLLDKVDGQICTSYAKKTGKDDDEIMQMMADETWMTEQEAVDAGFVDEVAEAGPKAEREGWDLSAYAKAPPASANVSDPPPPTKTVESDNEDDSAENSGAIFDCAAQRRRLELAQRAI